MDTSTADESQPGHAQVVADCLVEDGYAQLSAAFNTESANTERRTARGIYARRCQP
jgi:hypothetical protein